MLLNFAEYPDCRSDYDRLSEYVHPNTGQNIILTWPSPKNAQWARLSRQSEHAFITAVTASIRPTDTASCAIVKTCIQRRVSIQEPIGLSRSELN